jgi:Tol biopolymer transport system component
LTTQNSLNPNFAPDGRTIAYTSYVNKSTIATTSIDGGEPRQLTANQSGHPVFSPDGTQIACLYSEKQDNRFTIAIIPSAGGAPIKTFPLPSGFFFPFRWTADGKAITYGLRRRGVGNLWMQRIEGGEPKQLTNFTSDLIHSYDLSRDGKQFVFSRGTRSSDVVLFSGIKH